MELSMQLLQVPKRHNFNTPDDVIDYLVEDGRTPDRMQAVIRILEADDELKNKVTRCIDVERMDIDWYTVFNMDYSPSGYAGLIWAKSLWDANAMVGKDVFGLVRQMNEEMKKAVSDATNFAWDIPLSW